jgi:MFS family permease
MSARSLFWQAGSVPPEFRATFRHLYGDIGWFGVLNASALAFVAVYAARQGGSPFQVGLLTAGPAIVNLLVAIPIGHWLQRQAIGRAVFWSSVANRLFYLPWIVLPALLSPSAQVWTLIGLTIAMSIPGAGLVIGFNALFAEAVPPTWRAYVTGIRNALLAVASVSVSLICGRILTSLPFPDGYQVVFGIGAMAGLMSSLHLWFVHRQVDRAAVSAEHSLASTERPTPPTDAEPSPRRASGWLRSRLIGTVTSVLRIEILATPFRRVLAVLLVFHIAQYVVVPIVPVYMVNALHLEDQQIGLATAVFWLFTFAASLQMASLARLRGHQWVTGSGVILMACYPGLMASATSFGMISVLAASALGGLGYALFIGAFLNYILERTPQADRPAHLAWYNIVFNAAILIGSLLGPFVVGQIGFVLALVLFAASRIVAGLFILKAG